MPQYYYLKYVPKAERSRVVGNLERLINQLDREVPDKDSEQTLQSRSDKILRPDCLHDRR